MGDRRTEGDAVPGGQRRNVGAGRLLALLGAGPALVATVVLTATPAQAAQDPARPRATVTRGPSCLPGGLELQVRAGTVAVHVVLATTRHPEGEDATDLPAGGTGVLRSGDVAPGETIDSRLVTTPADGSGETWVDELDDWTLTRPTEADCAVATAAPTADPAPPSAAGAAPAGPSAVVTEGAAGSDGASSRAVGAGRPITVSARGFVPGEAVTVRLAGGSGLGEVLARGTAGPDGTVTLRLTVPSRAAGATGLDLTGGSSGTATRLQLQVAALRMAAPARRVDGDGTPALPALAALVSLAVVGGALVPVARRSAALRRSGRGPGCG